MLKPASVPMLLMQGREYTRTFGSPRAAEAAEAALAGKRLHGTMPCLELDVVKHHVARLQRSLVGHWQLVTDAHPV
jgi:hypothetical protein